MKRTIVGVQLHHSVNLSDASRFAANMLTALESAKKRVKDKEEIQGLIDKLTPMVLEIGVARQASELRLKMHQNDANFSKYVDGDLPWPDEEEDSFQARCRCEDKCIFHDFNRGSEKDCNCGLKCHRHDTV